MTEVLLIHTPKFQNYYPPLGYFMSVTKMPAGLLGLADIISKMDIKVKTVHLGVEKIHDKSFSLSRLLKQENPKMVGISLHFHPQSFDVVKTIKTVRETLPETFIFLGGYTASFFGYEILASYPEVNAIIKGDGELPVKELTSQIIKQKSSPKDIPNLIWNDGPKTIKQNETSSVTTTDDLKDYSRTKLSLMLHPDTYALIAQYLHFYRLDKNLSFNLKLIKHMDGFPLPLIRGCPFSCTYCGGGKDAQLTINNRNHLATVPIPRAFEELKNLSAQNVQIFFMEYVPLGDKDSYYVQLFETINREKLPIQANIECRSFPSEQFLFAFSKTFCAPDSRLVFSLDNSDESKRTTIRKGMHLSNSALMETLSIMENLNIASEIFYTIGLPEDSLSDIKETKNQIHILRSTFSKILAIRVHTVELDPASPMYQNPEKQNITDHLKTFEDYVHYHESANSMFDGLGYGLKNKNGKYYTCKEYRNLVSAALCQNFCRAINQRVWRLPEWMQKTLMTIVSLGCALKRKIDHISPPKDPFPY